MFLGMFRTACEMAEEATAEPAAELRRPRSVSVELSLVASAAYMAMWGVLITFPRRYCRNRACKRQQKNSATQSQRTNTLVNLKITLRDSVKRMSKIQNTS